MHKKPLKIDGTDVRGNFNRIISVSEMNLLLGENPLIFGRDVEPLTEKTDAPKGRAYRSLVWNLFAVLLFLVINSLVKMF